MIKNIGSSMEQDSYRRSQFLKAEEKVKEIKGLYLHLFIYLIVNLAWVIVLLVMGEMSSYSKNGFWGMGYGQLSMALFWGIGLLIHWLFVFIKNFSISKNWEKRKIKEILEKDKQLWE